MTISCVNESTGNRFLLTPFNVDEIQVNYYEEDARQAFAIEAWLDENGRAYAEIAFLSHVVQVEGSTLRDALIKLESVLQSHYPHIMWECPVRLDFSQERVAA